MSMTRPQAKDKRDECGCHRGCVTTFHACTRPCRWPSCLTEEEHAELAAEVLAVELGEDGAA